MIVISVNDRSVTAYLCNASGINSVIRGKGHGSLTSKGATNFHIGLDPYPGRQFKGKMGVAMVYSVALSSADITSILNAWKHIVLSRISGQATLYLDGISKVTYSLPDSLMSNQLNVIGTITPNFYSPGYFILFGKIAVTRIYKGRGFTAAEALTHFDLTKSRFSF